MDPGRFVSAGVHWGVVLLFCVPTLQLKLGPPKVGCYFSVLLGSCISSRHKGWVWEFFGSVWNLLSFLLAFLVVETAQNAARFSVWFFLGFGVFLLRVLLFLGVVWQGFLSDLVPHGRFRGDMLGFAVFWWVLMVIFQMFWSVLVCLFETSFFL